MQANSPCTINSRNGSKTSRSSRTAGCNNWRPIIMKLTSVPAPGRNDKRDTNLGVLCGAELDFSRSFVHLCPARGKKKREKRNATKSNNEPATLLRSSQSSAQAEREKNPTQIRGVLVFVRSVVFVLSWRFGCVAGSLSTRDQPTPMTDHGTRPRLLFRFHRQKPF